MKYRDYLTLNPKVLDVLIRQTSDLRTYLSAIVEINDLESSLDSQKIFDLYRMLLPRAKNYGISPNFIMCCMHIKSLLEEFYQLQNTNRGILMIDIVKLDCFSQVTEVFLKHSILSLCFMH